jgi:hypothetical protein
VKYHTEIYKTSIDSRPNTEYSNKHIICRYGHFLIELEPVTVIVMISETMFQMPQPNVGSIKLRFHTDASKHGHFRPPAVFYEGVTYGLTWENSHHLEVSLVLIH